MRFVVQRVSEARVEVDGNTVAKIGRGLVVLEGIRRWPQFQSGKFAAHMHLHLVNDGPVTLILE